MVRSAKDPRGLGRDLDWIAQEGRDVGGTGSRAELGGISSEFKFRLAKRDSKAFRDFCKSKGFTPAVVLRELLRGPLDKIRRGADPLAEGSAEG